MKCPHCSYANGWSAEKLDVVDGLHGEFFELKITLERNVFQGWGKVERSLYACPAPDCGKTFIEN